MIFVPWKKGNKYYLKISPYLFYLLITTNYIIIPFGNIVLSAYFTLNPSYDLKAKPLESWVIFFTVLCFCRMVEYFTDVKKVVMDDAKVYLETRKAMENGKLDEIKEENDMAADRTGENALI